MVFVLKLGGNTCGGPRVRLTLSQAAHGGSHGVLRKMKGLRRKRTGVLGAKFGLVLENIYFRGTGVKGKLKAA